MAGLTGAAPTKASPPALRGLENCVAPRQCALAADRGVTTIGSKRRGIVGRPWMKSPDNPGHTWRRVRTFPIFPNERDAPPHAECRRKRSHSYQILGSILTSREVVTAGERAQEFERSMPGMRRTTRPSALTETHETEAVRTWLPPSRTRTLPSGSVSHRLSWPGTRSRGRASAG